MSDINGQSKKNDKKKELIHPKLQVLIVDDSPNMLRSLANMLRVLGIEDVLRADNGKKGLEVARTNTLDIILSDWNMPEMTGVDFLRAVRQDDRLKNMPFLLITAEVDRGTVAEAAEMDVDGYLLKPFTLNDLNTKMEEVLQKRRTPSPTEVHLAVTKVYMESKQYDMALTELQKALKIQPRNPRIAYAIGEVYEAKEDYESAEQYYQRSLQYGKHFVKGHDAMARLYEHAGKLEDAAGELKKAVNISPKNLNRQLNLGQVLVKTGQTDEMAKVLKTVMVLAEENKAEVGMQVGEAFLEAGMAAEAQKVFSMALTADPKAIPIYNRLGIALRRQKKFTEAVNNYLLAIEIDPENEVLYYNVGRAYWEAKDKEKSIENMKKALKIDPEFEEAKVFLQKVEKKKS